jgi:hypothetical protein
MALIDPTITAPLTENQGNLAFISLAGNSEVTAALISGLFCLRRRSAFTRDCLEADRQ